MGSRFTFALVVVLALAVVGAGATLVFSRFLDFGRQPVIASTLPTAVPGAAQAGAAGAVAYAPPKLEDAPKDIRDAVLLGANILTDTQKYTADYVGNTLNCTNCHFNGGVSEGGKNGGLSLVGVAVKYPAFRSRQNYSVDLITRTNDCFLRSMNGKALPPEGKEMTAIMTYYHWISKGLPIYAEIPWLGLKTYDTKNGNKEQGAQVFSSKCSPCHGADGQGTAAAPPVWGDKSYNSGAGMAKSATLAGFALLNMPKGNPTLTEQEAIDVAVYVDGQPRPHFTAQ